MKKLQVLFLVGLLVLTGCTGKRSQTALQGETKTFTDSLGREVELRVNPTKIAPCGSIAQMILYTLAPEYLVGIANNLDERTKPFIPEEYWNLPQFGQLYGKNTNLNIEALVAAGPDVIIDMGDIKENMAADLNGISEQIGLPVIFIEATLESMPEAYRTLGRLLNKVEKGEELAQYCEKTLELAKEIRANVETPLTAYYGTGTDGLASNARGSIHAEVLGQVGVDNATVVENVSQKGGGNQVDLEQVLLFDPDLILLATGGPYKRVFTDAVWSELKAVKTGRVYEIPNKPYDFLSAPPAMNRIIGIHWLAWVAYPEYYNYNLVEEMQTFYRLFYNYELTTKEAEQLL